MARSTYVYVVQDIDNHHELVAGFTVKHELQTWIERNPGEYYVTRLPDGGHGKPSELRL